MRGRTPERLPIPTSPSHAFGAGPSLSPLKGGEGLTSIEIFRQRLHLLRRRGKPELGAAPQHILGRPRPFPLDEPAQLGFAEALSEIAAKRRGVFRIAQDLKAVLP